AIEFSGFITDVQQSSLYVELVTRGSVVATSESEGLDLKIPDAGATMHAEATQLWNAQTQFWIEHFRTTLASGETEYCANYLKQKYVENILWNAVIEADLDSRRHRFSDEQRLNAQALRADGLREIIAPPLAGFMVATLSSFTSAQFVLLNIARNLTELEHLMHDLRLESAGRNQSVEPAAVLLPLDVGEHPSVTHALEQAVRFDDVFGVPAESASSGADVFAQLLMGHSSIGPCWERVDSLELLISLFANLVEGEQLAHLLLMRSWISWFKGESSLASAAMLQAQEASLAGGVPLEILLERSIIPEWVSHSDQCYKSRKLG
ncbi:MAG: hypothetical protein Q3974_09710, partial [Rothia sp. (in: high G+C Gram-positive bacteria)]|nr:hypothetical protein [Rothia sp. (in: high G+C Gram-positive bacteria)]